jgi:signal transduction histidine kinase/DNA-binding response OmpR family regulator
LANETILVVDDSREVASLVMEHILEPAGYRVLLARDGLEGLQRIEEDKPDLILLDLEMPSLGGMGVLDALQERKCRTPIILMTSHGSEQLAVTVFRKGVKDYVIKPMEAEELLRVIEKALIEVRLRTQKDELTEGLLKANRELERRVKELNALYGIGRSVTSLLELDRLLSRIVEAAVYITGAEEGSLLLLDDETNELFVRSAQGLDEKYAREFRLKVDDSLAGEVIKKGEPIIIGGSSMHHKVKTSYLVYSILYVPLKNKGRVIGVLTVDNRVSQHEFSKNDLFLLSLLSDYAAVAIDNARLFGQIENERQTMEAILSGTEDMIMLTDEQNCIKLLNAAARRGLGIQHPSPEGQPLAAIIDNHYLLNLYADPGGQESATRAEIPLESQKTVLATLSPVPGIGRVAVMKDITHLKRLDQMKSEFVATVSHDLRSPLTSIRGFADLMPIVGPLTPQQQGFLQKIRRGVEDITNLINDLLDIGRIEAGIDLEKESCDMAEIVADTVAKLSNQALDKEQTLTFDTETPNLPVLGSRLRLHQAVNNLVGNAVKYTRAGGNIRVTASTDDHYVSISVQDNGIGIPISEQALIFDKFYRVQSDETQNISGTGLGLSIVKSIIEKHQGRIWVESTPGEGSTFTILLPKSANGPSVPDSGARVAASG